MSPACHFDQHPQGITFLARSSHSSPAFLRGGKHSRAARGPRLRHQKDIGPRAASRTLCEFSEHRHSRRLWNLFINAILKQIHGWTLIRPSSSFYGSYNKSNFQSYDWFNPLPPEHRAAPRGNSQTRRTRDATCSVEPYRRGGSTATLFYDPYVGNTSHHMANLEMPNQARPGPGSFESARAFGQPSGHALLPRPNSNANYRRFAGKGAEDLRQRAFFLPAIHGAKHR